MRAETLSLWLLLLLVTSLSRSAVAKEPVRLHRALEKLAREEKFSGAVVVRGADGVRFARGYGWADPFERRPFTPETPADSASLAKPVTAAAVLLLVHEGKIELDAQVQRYLPEYPHPATSVHHLLSHSAGLRFADEVREKSNAQLLAEAGDPQFPPGSTFNYCNLCSVALAMLIERVAGTNYLEFVQQHLALPSGVTLRPARLADWTGRAIGYRRTKEGQFQRFDSWEGEQFYGPANFSISAAQLAAWGSEWWQPRLAPIRRAATTRARIRSNESGLTLGNWYCAPGGRQCHYLGHHEGFHHMLYWDADRRISVAMLSNNTLAPGLQQRLQRALVAFARDEPDRAASELGRELDDRPVPVGQFKLASGENVEVLAKGEDRSVRRDSIEYPAYLIGSGIRYVPGLDLYLAGTADGRLRWLTLYEDHTGAPAADRAEGR